MIVHLAPFATHSPVFGGAERIHQLAQHTHGHVLSLDWSGRPDSTVTVGNATFETITPGDAAQAQAKKLFPRATTTFDPIPRLTRKHLSHVTDRILELNPSVIVSEHPWLLDLIPLGIPVIYDAHNNETINATERVGGAHPETQLVQELERDAINRARHLITCTQRDWETLYRVHKIDRPHTVIPNGVTLPERTTRPNGKTLLFVGSLYGPNVKAANALVQQAGNLPDYQIVIAGGVGNPFTQRNDNVTITGHVSDDALHRLYSTAYAFVNLTTEGTGTPLKVGRALAYGVPVIATANGARGYTTPTVIDGPADLRAALDQLDPEWVDRSRQARAEAETLTWAHHAPRLLEVINAVR